MPMPSHSLQVRPTTYLARRSFVPYSSKMTLSSKKSKNALSNTNKRRAIGSKRKQSLRTVSNVRIPNHYFVVFGGWELRTIAIQVQLEEIRAYHEEYKAHLEALQNGETFKPTLTGKGTKESKKASGKKRKVEERSPISAAAETKWEASVAG